MERRRQRGARPWAIVLVALGALVAIGVAITGLAAADVPAVDSTLETVSAQADLPVDLSRPQEWALRLTGRPVIEERPSQHEGIRTGSIVFEDDDFVATIFVPLTTNQAVNDEITRRLERRIDQLAERLQIGDLDQTNPPTGPRPEVRDEINVTFDVDYASATVVAVALKSRIVKRGNAPLTAVDTMILNLADGSEIATAALFRPGSNYLQRLSQLSQQQLQATLPADLRDAAGQARLAAGTAPTEANFNGVSIAPDWETGILVYFDEGQVTPPGREPPRIGIALDALKDSLNPAVIALTHPRYAARLQLQGRPAEPTSTAPPPPPTATPPNTPTATQPSPAAPSPTAPGTPAAPSATVPVAPSATPPGVPAAPSPAGSPRPAAPTGAATAVAPTTVATSVAPTAIATPAAPPKAVATAASPTAAPPPKPQPSPAAPKPAPGPVDCSTQRCIALTFDDGPQSPLTQRILDTLRSEGGRATFFVLGQKVAQEGPALQRMVAEGHEIGNHTWSHKQLTTLTEAEVRQEIQSTQDAVRAATGQTPRSFRPPYGATNAAVQAAAGLPQVLWNVDTDDWKDRDSEVVTQRVLAGARPGAIVLMHDIHATTAQAVPAIVRGLKSQGYALVTVSQLRGG